MSLLGWMLSEMVLMGTCAWGGSPRGWQAWLIWLLFFIFIFCLLSDSTRWGMIAWSPKHLVQPCPSDSADGGAIRLPIRIHLLSLLVSLKEEHLWAVTQLTRKRKGQKEGAVPWRWVIWSHTAWGGIWGCHSSHEQGVRVEWSVIFSKPKKKKKSERGKKSRNKVAEIWICPPNTQYPKCVNMFMFSK